MKAVVFGSFIAVISLPVVASYFPGLIASLLVLLIGTAAGAWFADLDRPVDYLAVAVGVLVLTIVLVGCVLFVEFRVLWGSGY